VVTFSLIISLAKANMLQSHEFLGNFLSSEYLGNLYIYFTWTSTFFLCALYGAFNIVLFADRGAAYINCNQAFHSQYPMGSMS
jgi:hypothetical protein